MSQVLAEDTQATTLGADPDITVNVSVSATGAISVDTPYVAVSKGKSRKISWALNADPGITVEFDNPAISMFGEDAPVSWTTKESALWTGTWHNTSRHGLSFCYRIHVLQMVGSSYVPLTTDPIIHNDPPPYQ